MNFAKTEEEEEEEEEWDVVERTCGLGQREWERERKRGIEREGLVSERGGFGGILVHKETLRRWAIFVFDS